ncbi:MAG: DDE-type integrase/transposase/recombinase [Chloroflexi bacterium]|nr:DDE-type integrase/transposase/recombinase [Chloroflexota bacterium]
MHDRTYNEAPFRLLNVIDEYTREALLIRVQHRMNHQDALTALSWLILLRGLPAHIRSDTGSEFTAEKVRRWLAKMEVRPLFIEPGSPGKTGTLRASMGSCVMSCWTGRSSAICGRHRC